ncbi:hypothetical protein B0J13DRAFT_610690 [Dactylonectria estremocensis]|uniref:Uncharacterized protein n=1 Tax=Dactylonectria estremocensis TaxID=1079267 RepID=A0A9P9E3B1_9HYPO|nr:hypothetical protein B0J13DRAFT_610690 [Dactylonectria estremocensis]
MRLSTRLSLVGPLSLASLFVGGLLLIIVGANTLSAPRGKSRKPGEERVSYLTGEFVQFNYGAHLSVQAWLAIVGIALGLLSFGFRETYTHVFDWWCSRQAKTQAGLDYGRYLNSQAHAPVIYGSRGFGGLVTVRYCLILASIAASVGYKFGIVQIDAETFEVLDDYVFMMSPPPLNGLHDGAISPWFSDQPSSALNQAFAHDTVAGEAYFADPFEPPKRIMMAGIWQEVTFLFDETDWGQVYNREVVMVAEKSEEKSTFTMASNHTGWTRVQTSNRTWVGEDEPAQAVVDYRIVEPGKVQIQWARLGCWFSGDCDSDKNTTSQSVAHRLTYTMRYAVAEVARDLQNGGSLRLFNSEITLLSTDDEPPVTEYSNGSLPLYENWLNAIISSDETSVLYGVSAFVRAVMAGWGSVGLDKIDGPRLKILRADEQPFGPEESETGLLATDYHLDITNYPFFKGVRRGRLTGCYFSAAYVFTIVGIISFLVAMFRVWLGPAQVTSWMGQHVYMALRGAVSIEGDPADLATGYKVAPQELGRLRLVSDASVESHLLKVRKRGDDNEP